MDDKSLRKNLIELLDGGNAYAPTKRLFSGLKPKNRHARPPDSPHSIWEVLEHMRIAQEDILRYTLDSRWKSPDWPKGYWPDPAKTPMPSAWNSAIKRFFADLDEFKALVRNRKIDLTAEIPHGEGRTYLRQILLAADHNSYHSGQIVLLRRLLKDWQE